MSKVATNKTAEAINFVAFCIQNNDFSAENSDKLKGLLNGVDSEVKLAIENVIQANSNSLWRSVPTFLAYNKEKSDNISLRNEKLKNYEAIKKMENQIIELNNTIARLSLELNKMNIKLKQSDDKLNLLNKKVKMMKIQ